MNIYHQQIPVPMDHNGSKETWIYDTEQELLTEQNVNVQAMRVADTYAKWAFASAHYKKKIQLKKTEMETFLARATKVATEQGRASGFKYESEKAKMQAMINYKDATGKYSFAEEHLMLKNEIDDLEYYQNIIDGAILESLKIKKEMIITIGAQIRAGLGAQNLTVKQ